MDKEKSICFMAIDFGGDIFDTKIIIAFHFHKGNNK